MFDNVVECWMVPSETPRKHLITNTFDVLAMWQRIVADVAQFIEEVYENRGTYKNRVVRSQVKRTYPIR